MKITIDLTEDETQVSSNIEIDFSGVTIHQLGVASTILGMPGTDKLDSLKDAQKARENLLARISKIGIMLSLKEMLKDVMEEQKTQDGEKTETESVDTPKEETKTDSDTETK